ncbi:MAG: hypothetical protein LZF62_260052 [Nitrospira sp.]|nr:MAG: hypothetical protein LZF62_260052 [Nitrospira sp.]
MPGQSRVIPTDLSLYLWAHALLVNVPLGMHDVLGKGFQVLMRQFAGGVPRE